MSDVLSDPVAVDGDSRLAQFSEKMRTEFDCSGTVWETYVYADRRPTCHRMPMVQGAPDVNDCNVRVEVGGEVGGYKVVPPGDVFAPGEISEDWLFLLGGGRRYRVSLRHKGNTMKHSYLTFDLTARGDARPLPHEREEQTTAPAQEPAPTAPEVDGFLKLGALPVDALLGRAVAGVGDPMAQFAFAMLLRDAAREREMRLDQGQRDERMFQMALGTMGAAARSGGGSGSSELAAYLRTQQDTANARLATLEAETRAARDERHKMELATAQGAHAPNPLYPLLVAAGERVITAGVVKAVENAGPEGAAKLVNLAAAAVGGATS